MQVCVDLYANMQCTHVFMSVCVYVCVPDEEGSRVFASGALGVVQTAMYLAGYSDCPTSCHEPLSPPYTYHTNFKKCLVQSLFQRW